MMDPKLQQAIVAARAGNFEAAQLLLAAVLQEDPQEADAWFLMAHLVDPPERQARYLEYAQQLDPENALIARRLQSLRQPEVPPPVINSQAGDKQPSVMQSEALPELTDDFIAVPAAQTNPGLTKAVENAPQAAPLPSTVQTSSDYDSKRIDNDWQKTAGSPKRLTSSQMAIPITAQPRRENDRQASEPVKVTPVAQPPAQKPSATSKWLMAILLVLVILTFFLLSFLAYTMFFE